MTATVRQVHMSSHYTSGVCTLCGVKHEDLSEEDRIIDWYGPLRGKKAGAERHLRRVTCEACRAELTRRALEEA